MNLSAEDHILTNSYTLLQISNDHHEHNPDMYNHNDITVGDQLTDSLIDIHQAWSDLKLYGVHEDATRQLCQSAAKHFKLLYHVHSLPYIAWEYAYEKLLLIQHLSNEDNVFEIVTTPMIRNAWAQNADISINNPSNTLDNSDMSLDSSINLNSQWDQLEYLRYKIFQALLCRLT